jgi:hypothetical protein
VALILRRKNFWLANTTVAGTCAPSLEAQFKLVTQAVRVQEHEANPVAGFALAMGKSQALARVQIARGSRSVAKVTATSKMKDKQLDLGFSLPEEFVRLFELLRSPYVSLRRGRHECIAFSR